MVSYNLRLRTAPVCCSFFVQRNVKGHVRAERLVARALVIYLILISKHFFMILFLHYSLLVVVLIEV